MALTRIFRPKDSVVVEAVRVRDLMVACARGDVTVLAGWTREALERTQIVVTMAGAEVYVGDGVVRGDRDDWIVRLPDRKIHLYTAQEFDNSYEEAD